jgi:nitrite reductase/ring-hydroxylating ferredoxin subunit
MSNPDGFARVARLSELSEKRGKMVQMGDRAIALWRIDGTVYALDDRCPHQHFPTMHLAQREGKTLICPMHGWTFSVESGIEKTGRGRIATFRVQVIGDDIYVEEPTPSW